MADANFDNVELLLHFDGADGATTTVDNSKRFNILTFAGNAQLDTALKKFGTASLLTDGVDDAFEVKWQPGFDFAAGAFTVEFEVNGGASEPGGSVDMCGIWNTGFNDRVWKLRYDPTTNRVFFDYSTTGSNTISNAYFELGTDGVDVATFFDGNFHHIAVIRSGSNIYLHVDGQVGSGVDTTNPTLRASSASGKTSLLLGGVGATGTITGDFAGSFDEFRITKGVARYTPGTDFTPPVAAHEEDDFLPTTDPNFSDVVLLLNFEGTNDGTTFEDLSNSEHVITVTGGDTTSTDQAKFGSLSLHHVKNGRLNVGDVSSADWNFGSGDWTIDFWLYMPAESGLDNYLFSFGNVATSPDKTPWGMFYSASPNAFTGYFQVGDGTVGPVQATFDLDTAGAGTGPAAMVARWNHLHLTRNGSDLIIGFNGWNVINAAALSGSQFDFAADGGVTPPAIGAVRSGTGATKDDLPFYMDGFRITKGVARFTGSTYIVPDTEDAYNFAGTPPASSGGAGVVTTIITL